jgi:hypothetical protein
MYVSELENTYAYFSIRITLDNRHEYGTAEGTLGLLTPFSKGTRMNWWEALYMQAFHQHNTLIKEEQVICF